MMNVRDDLSQMLYDHHWVIDTRVNMLMPGQYPSIPGWHCDDVPRGEKYAQPDFAKCQYGVNHWMCLISDTVNTECISGTEFLKGTREYEINPDKVWQSLHEAVEADTEKETFKIKERDIVKFNQYEQNTTYHTARIFDSCTQKIFLDCLFTRAFFDCGSLCYSYLFGVEFKRY